MGKFGTHLIVVVAIVLAAGVAAPAITRTEMVAMRDGTKLAADIYLPDGEGPWPALVVRTPYGRINMKYPAAEAVKNGYACVTQDFRGRGDSEGVDYPVFLNDGWGEKKDGYDTVEWIAAQDWCNGKVGAFGVSAPGIALNMMAPSRPPHLKCLYICVAFSSMYHQSTYQGGAFRKALVENWLNGNQFHPRSLEMIREHPDYDDFWRSINPELVLDRTNVPVMYEGGWYDIFSPGMINGYRIVQHSGDVDARGNCRLVMGPYGHGSSVQLKFPNPKAPEMASAWHWFDVWMKDDGRGAEDIANVYYYVMGDPADKDTPGNRWRTADDWPIEATDTPLYMHADGSLSQEPATQKNASLSYRYDPDDPVPTIGGANLTITKGPMDQRPIGERQDVLVFKSEELDEYLEITGDVRARIWASSSATDTDFTAKLMDIYPDGRQMIVVDGIIRARHRNSMEKSELMEPGEIYCFDIDLWPTSLVFSPGHRIAVAISSSNSPRFEPNPNTGEVSGANGETVVATNRLYLDSKHRSHIILPVVSK